ncbi:hypothetical protein H5410_011442, partial [Solanum commersonii]
MSLSLWLASPCQHVQQMDQELIIMDNQATSNEQLMIAYTKKSIISTGSLQLTPFEDEIISIVDAHQHLPAYRGDSIVQLAAVLQILFQALNHPLIYSYNRCQFDITITDNSGSTTTLIADEAAETMLHLTSEEIYDIRCTKCTIITSSNEHSSKRKTGKDKEEATSHRMHAPEPKTPPPKHYNK